jgi:uncharacterized membrane protein YjfL (UPF0719 family)
MPDIDLVGQVLAYSGVGFAVLVAGFYVIDGLTPGHLGGEIMAGNRNAALIASATLVSLGLVMWFAIYFTGAGWSHLDDAAIFGLVGVGTQAAGFFLLDLLTPGRLGDICKERAIVPGAWVAASVQVAAALIVCASLT